MSDHCRICHQDFTDPSFGGPGICPACDCGIPPDVTRLQRTVAALTAENEQLKAAMTEWAGMSGAVEIAISDLTNQSPWTALEVLRKARTFGDRARAALPSSRETTDGRTDPS